MKPPRLSIIIPAYQEASRIKRSLAELARYLDNHHLRDVEVLVVVADSPDGTAALAESMKSKFNRLRIVPAGPKIGKGYQVRLGMMEAKGEYRLFMDADLATPLYYIQEVLSQAKLGAEVIIAVRDLATSHSGFRKGLSSVGNWLVRLTLLPGVQDTQCGFKAFSKAAVDDLFRRQTIMGWGFDMEILAIARMQRYKVAQIKVPDWSDKPNGTFEGQVASAALRTLWDLATILVRRLTGRYRSKHFTYKPDIS